jgi:hypothetical protein
MNHPSWKTLVKIAREEALRTGKTPARVFRPIGLKLQRPSARDTYWCTPINSRCFAKTGRNGVHFSFVVPDDEVNEHCPVVMTVPGLTATGENNLIVGENLWEFLCLGIRFGFGVLEQLTYKPQEFIAAYANREWRPTRQHQVWAGYKLDGRQRRLLDVLVQGFGLVLWSDVQQQLLQLQKRYHPLLDLPPGKQDKDEEW